MEEEDKDNLNFLLTASEETLLEWYKDATEDDLIYAKELLDYYQLELRIKSGIIIYLNVETDYLH